MARILPRQLESAPKRFGNPYVSQKASLWYEVRRLGKLSHMFQFFARDFRSAGWVGFPSRSRIREPRAEAAKTEHFALRVETREAIAARFGIGIGDCLSLHASSSIRGGSGERERHAIPKRSP